MLSITRTAPASDQEWDEAADTSPAATFFHSRAWAEIWHRYEPAMWAPAPVSVQFSDDRVAILPITSAAARLRVTVHLSSPAGTYGGWISGDKLTTDHVSLLRKFILERFRDLEWRVNPFDPAVHEALLDSSSQDFTQVVDLTPGMEEVVATWTRGHRSAARKALRSGLVVREARSDADWHAYYDLYRGSLERWGRSATSRYRMKFFDAVRTVAGSQAKLWLGELDGALLAGALCFYAGRRIAYWHGASSRADTSVRPSNGLLYEVMRQGGEAGYELFDFCPSGGHEGVVSFKSSFGATVLPSPMIINQSARAAVTKRARRVFDRLAGPGS